MTKLTPIIAPASNAKAGIPRHYFNVSFNDTDAYRLAKRADIYKQRGFFALPKEPIKQAACWDFLRCVKS